jgi:ankyrin repeat protein
MSHEEEALGAIRERLNAARPRVEPEAARAWPEAARIARAAATGEREALAMALGEAGGPQEAAKACEAAGGRTPLGLAAGAGHVACVSELLAAGVADGPDADGVWAIHWAGAAGAADCCLALVAASPTSAREPAPAAWGKLTPLMWAAREGQAAAVEALLPFSDPLAAACLEYGGLTALMLASSPRNDADDCVRALAAASEIDAAGIGVFRGRTALSFAATQSEATTRALLSLGADASKIEQSGLSPLAFAALHGQPGCMRALMEAGDFQRVFSGKLKEDWRKASLLMLAARGGSLECLELSLPLCDAKAMDESGWTALTHAVFCGSADCAERLLPLSDFRATDAQGLDALHWAATGGHARCVELLIARDEGRELGGGEWGALALAAKTGDAECVRALLATQDPTQAGPRGETPLGLAAEAGAAECVEALLADGRSDPEARQGIGELTPLMLAAIGKTDGHAACVAALAPRSSVDARAGERRIGGALTALMLAVQADNAKSARALLACGADPLAKDDKGRTACAHAVAARGAECAQLLLDRLGLAAFGETDAEGDPFLRKAALEGDASGLRKVELLLASGAEINRSGPHGTALMGAAAGGSADCVERLLAAGADPHVLGDDQRDALRIALNAGNDECLRLLVPASDVWRPRAASASSSAQPGAVGSCALWGREGSVAKLRVLLSCTGPGERQEEIAEAAVLATQNEKEGAWELLAVLCERVDASKLADHGAALARAIVKRGLWSALDILSATIPQDKLARVFSDALQSLAPQTAMRLEQIALRGEAERSAGAAPKQERPGRRL